MVEPRKVASHADTLASRRPQGGLAARCVLALRPSPSASRSVVGSPAYVASPPFGAARNGAVVNGGHATATSVRFDPTARAPRARPDRRAGRATVGPMLSRRRPGLAFFEDPIRSSDPQPRDSRRRSWWRTPTGCDAGRCTGALLDCRTVPTSPAVASWCSTIAHDGRRRVGQRLGSRRYGSFDGRWHRQALVTLATRRTARSLDLRGIPAGRPVR